ncbi:hypothetical protein [Mycoplasma sp. 3686d]|uniref:hypothetical protein n=1 Tax=Mycoplasma sp. 3686d TaxID=2967300 RepID=UPI00211C1132|nr:hypothetical protein [Mycoplasma sp. 3686d]UUM24564.1 hypothetical protein NPA12_02580 [Mycoplasma sp. 3686d]
MFKTKIKKWFLISSGLTVTTLISAIPISCLENQEINNSNTTQYFYSNLESAINNQNDLLNHIQTTIQNSQFKDSNLIERLAYIMSWFPVMLNQISKQDIDSFFFDWLNGLFKSSQEIIDKYKEHVFFPSKTKHESVIFNLKNTKKEILDIQSELTLKQEKLNSIKDTLNQHENELSKNKESLTSSQKELEKDILDLKNKILNKQKKLINYVSVFKQYEDYKFQAKQIRTQALQWQIETNNLDKIIALPELSKPQNEEKSIEYWNRVIDVYIESFNINSIMFEKITQQMNLNLEKIYKVEKELSL